MNLEHISTSGTVPVSPYFSKIDAPNYDNISNREHIPKIAFQD
jgi:hypothetical protein